MKQLIEKVFGISVLVILATSFFDSAPLWFNIFFIAPILFIAVRSVMKHHGDSTRQACHDSSSSSTLHRRSYHASSISRQSSLLGCSSLSDRIKTLGF